MVLEKTLESSLDCKEIQPVHSEGDQPEKETEGERERKRKKDTVTKALMEQRCFNQHGVGIYTVLQGSYSQQR